MPEESECIPAEKVASVKEDGVVHLEDKELQDLVEEGEEVVGRRGEAAADALEV